MSRRTSFTLYRRGNSNSASTIAPAWLSTFAPALGAMRDPSSTAVAPRGMRGEVVFGLTYTAGTGDVLKEALTGRVFVITQISKNPSTQMAHIAELPPPISDDFDTGVLEQFWNSDGTVFTLDSLNGNLVITTQQGRSPYLSQAVKGDFDIYARVRCGEGSGIMVTRNTVRVGIIAANSTSLPSLTASALVGVQDGGSAIFFHEEVFSGSSTTESSASLARDAWAFVRLRRDGARFAGYYSNVQFDPLRDSDWIEILGANSWLTTDDVYVGLFASSTRAGVPIESRIDYFRHWISVSR